MKNSKINKKKKKGLEACEILALFKLYKITQQSIADEQDPPVWVSAVCNAIHGRSKSKKQRSAIAEALRKKGARNKKGVPITVKDIWPLHPM